MDRFGRTLELPFGGESGARFFWPTNRAAQLRYGLDDFEVTGTRRTIPPASRAGFVYRPREQTGVAARDLDEPSADYPVFPGVSLLGTAYKFSQASWNRTI